MYTIVFLFVHPRVLIHTRFYVLVKHSNNVSPDLGFYIWKDTCLWIAGMIIDMSHVKLFGIMYVLGKSMGCGPGKMAKEKCRVLATVAEKCRE